MIDFVLWLLHTVGKPLDHMVESSPNSLCTCSTQRSPLLASPSSISGARYRLKHRMTRSARNPPSSAIVLLMSCGFPGAQVIVSTGRCLAIHAEALTYLILFFASRIGSPSASFKAIGLMR